MIYEFSFEDIDKYLPQLTHLFFIDSGNEIIAERTFSPLIKLKKLKFFSYERFSYFVTVSIKDSAICNLINNCQELQSIRMRSESKITYKTIDPLIEASHLFQSLLQSFECKEEFKILFSSL
jgi:hypothetical protein